MSLVNLALVAVLVAGAPLLGRALPKGAVPIVVIEILAGLVTGPHGLGWLSIDTTVSLLSLLGVTFLFFLAGLEVNLHVIRGSLLARSIGAYLLGLALALAGTTTLHLLGLLESPVLVALAFSATGLGLVIPILREAGILHTGRGALVVALASVAEFAAVVLLAVAFSTEGSPAGDVALLLLLAVLAVVVTAAGRRLSTYPQTTRLLDALSGGTTQLRVRLSVALVIAFAALAQATGLEVVLGAFFAGGILNVLDEGMRDPAFRGRLDGIGYGFLIPVFFVASGAQLDFSALAWWPDAVLVLPLLLVVLLAARGVPALVVGGTPVGRASVGTGLLCATSLPFIVTAAQVGAATGRIDAATAAVMTSAGLVGVCAFPAVGVRLLRREDRPASAAASSSRLTEAAGDARSDD